MTTLERLFDPRPTLDEPIALGALVIIAAALVLTPLLAMFLRKRNTISAKLADELILRTRSWAIIAPLVIGPILLGAALPAHILSPSVTSRGVVNMATLAVVEASSAD